MCHLHWTLHKSDRSTWFRFLCVCAFILWTVLWMHTWAIWYLTLCWIILCLPFTPRLWHCHYEWNCEMRPWMHKKTHPLMCITETRDGNSHVPLDAQDPPSHVHRITGKVALGQCWCWCTLAHGSPQGTISMQKMRILGVCQFFSKAKSLTVNFFRT